MTVYEHRTTVSTSAGTTSTSTLSIPGGLCRQVLIRANTSTTMFSANLTDDHGVIRRHYDFHRGEINDMDCQFAVVGSYGVTITNVSPDDTFTILFTVQE